MGEGSSGFVSGVRSKVESADADAPNFSRCGAGTFDFRPDPTHGRTSLRDGRERKLANFLATDSARTFGNPVRHLGLDIRNLRKHCLEL